MPSSETVAAGEEFEEKPIIVRHRVIVGEHGLPPFDGGVDGGGGELGGGEGEGTPEGGGVAAEVSDMCWGSVSISAVSVSMGRGNWGRKKWTHIRTLQLSNLLQIHTPPRHINRALNLQRPPKRLPPVFFAQAIEAVYYQDVLLAFNTDEMKQFLSSLRTGISPFYDLILPAFVFQA